MDNGGVILVLISKKISEGGGGLTEHEMNGSTIAVIGGYVNSIGRVGFYGLCIACDGILEVLPASFHQFVALCYVVCKRCVLGGWGGRVHVHCWPKEVVISVSGFQRCHCVVV